jgi:hypothetical protein
VVSFAGDTRGYNCQLIERIRSRAEHSEHDPIVQLGQTQKQKRNKTKRKYRKNRKNRKGVDEHNTQRGGPKMINFPQEVDGRLPLRLSIAIVSIG